MTYFLSSIWFCVYLTLVLPNILADKRIGCPQCPGPLAHYKALNCKPVLRTPADCCAGMYDCDHLYKRITKKKKKCYLNDRQYNIGRSFVRSAPDSHLCTEICTCFIVDNLADFKCASFGCDISPSAGRIIHPSAIEEHLKFYTEKVNCNETMIKSGCKKRGVKYLYGDYIIITDMSEIQDILICGYKKIGKWYRMDYITDLDIHAVTGFYKNCAPVYLSPYQGRYSVAQRKIWRCQTADDVVIPAAHSKDMKKHLFTHTEHGPLSALYCPYLSNSCLLINPEGTPGSYSFDMDISFLCRFGKMTMHIGDRLNNIKYNYGCIVCSCQIPPVPTCVWKQDMSCKQFAHEEKDVSKYIERENVEPIKDCIMITSHKVSPAICFKYEKSKTHAMCSRYKCVADPVFIE